MVATAQTRFPRTRVILPTTSKRPMVRLGSTLLAVAAIVGTLLVALAIGLGLYAYGHQGRIYQGVSVGGVDLSGMTPTEAQAALTTGFSSYMNTPVSLTYNGQAYAITPNQLGLQIDDAASVERAMDYGRQGSLWSRSQDWAQGLFGQSELAAVVVPSGQATDAALLALTPDVALAPTNASIDLSGSAPTIVPDVPGVGFDYGTTRSQIMYRVSTQSSAPVAIATTRLDAPITSETLKGAASSAQTATASGISIEGLNGQAWALDQNQIKGLVTISADGSTIVVNHDAVSGMVNNIAKSLETKSKDADLFVNGDGKLTVVPGTVAVSVDAKKSTAAVEAAIASGQGSVSLVIKQTDPAITTEMATASMASIQKTLGSGITIKWDGGTGKIKTADLLGALLIEATPGKADAFAFSLSHEILKGYIDTITNGYQVTPKEASFRLNNGVVTAVQKGRTGVVIDIDASADRIDKAIFAGYDSSTLKVNMVKPKYSASDAAKINLPDVLAEAATPYASSTDAKKTNIERAVDLENGWLVAPGDTFSYDDTMGQVTEDNGFVVGLGILADPNNPGQVTTGPVVGGGICQVSTTIFQSAFWAGMDFTERYQHPYWLNSYGTGEGGMKGLDAMVNIEPPDSTDAMTLDMKFVNTTNNWIAIQLTADGSNVTSQILGTNQGWDVEVGADDPMVSNIVQPDETEVRQESPELPAGTTRQVETAQDGFDTSITRTVTDKSGAVIDTYVLTSAYGSTVNRILVGTGTGG